MHRDNSKTKTMRRCSDATEYRQQCFKEMFFLESEQSIGCATVRLTEQSIYIYIGIINI